MEIHPNKIPTHQDIENNVIDQSQEVTLHEILDRVLNKGVVLAGDLVISVADIDLVYVGVRVLLSSVETLERIKSDKQEENEQIRDPNAGVNR